MNFRVSIPSALKPWEHQLLHKFQWGDDDADMEELMMEAEKSASDVNVQVRTCPCTTRNRGQLEVTIGKNESLNAFFPVRCWDEAPFPR